MAETGSPGRVQSFVTLALDGDGRTSAVHGPFDSEKNADAFGLAHCPSWTVASLTAPARGQS